MATLRAVFSFLLLVGLRAVSRIFYRHRVEWIGGTPDFSDVRLVAALNHTSLYEPLYAGALPVRLLWHFARRGVLPIADKTIRRPLTGLFFRFLVQDVIRVTRQQDETWQKLLSMVSPTSLVVIFPEGRMKRRDGLDADGKPMTVRGGIADILLTIPRGKMLVAYLGGLHHVQVPGQLLPKPFRRLRIRIETLDIEDYRERLLARSETGFKRAVIEDLQARRDFHCPALTAGSQAGRARQRDGAGLPERS